MENKPSLPTLALLLCLSILSSCQSRPPSFNFGAYSEAERFYEQGRYEKAIEKYQAYLRENPEGNMAAIASYSMAKSYEALGKLDQARPLYQKIIKEYSHLPWADFSKSRLKELDSRSE